MKRWLSILAALMLLISSAMAQENEVITLPAVPPLTWAETEPAGDYSFAQMEEYYNANFYMDREDYQAPRMTAEEIERAKALLADYQAGTRPEQNVLNKLDHVTVGVYTLNPEDYEGETLFTLLSVDPLTDEQILEVIDAFAQCGETFDPEALCFLNCMRGGGSGVTRNYQEEERTRLNALKDMYIRQGFVSEEPFTPFIADDGTGIVLLEEEAYCGRTRFNFLPCRRMTDDELLRYAIYTETGDPTEYGNYAAYEKQLRLELARLLGAPLGMTRDCEETGRMGDFNISYDDEPVYYAQFSTPDGARYSGHLDMDTNQVLTAWSSITESLLYSDLHGNPFDKKWLEVATQAVSQVRADNMAIRKTESFGEIWISMVGYGALVDVTMADGSYYEVKIPYQTGAVYNGLSYASHAPNLERMYADMPSDSD